MKTDAPLSPASPIAIIGMACWYPGARDPLMLWENILARRRQFRHIPKQRLNLKDYFDPDPNQEDKTYSPWAAIIDGFDFDWSGKRIPYSTFKVTDITHWLALEVALKAISDACYLPEDISGTKTGVIIGNCSTGEQTRAYALRLRWPYIKKAFLAAAQDTDISQSLMEQIEHNLKWHYKSAFPPTNEDSLAGSISNVIAGRICNFLNLRGGGYTVDGACSSSLIAITTAANGLTRGDIDLALAGGVDISLDPFELIGFAKTGALTMDEMRVYDRRGNGFIPGEGCGFVVLKRLKDAQRDKNYIYAVIHGWGVSSDGGGTGITAPKTYGQSLAIIKAYKQAPYDIQDLAFIEGHGTGTTVGDRVELEGIADAMSQKPGKGERICGVSSLKSIIGHTKAATGVGGLIKAVMAVNQRVIPPTAACEEPHPVFDTKAKQLYPILLGEVRAPTDILRAGVSSMGFGGINCHLTLASASPPSPRLSPSISEHSLFVSNQATEIFVFGASSINNLEKIINDHLKIAEQVSIAELTDLAAKLGQDIDKGTKVRGALLAGNPEQLRKRLKQLLKIIRKDGSSQEEVFHNEDHTLWFGNRIRQKKVGMLFPGQGSQQINMARVLVERFKWAQDLVKNTDQIFQEYGNNSLGSLIYRPSDRVKDPKELDGWSHTLSKTQNAQPAICLASLIWYQFLSGLGISPVAVGGHSLGELTAFHVAGAFDRESLLRLAVIRGKAMSADCEASAGAMLCLRCTRDKADMLLKQIPGYLVLANINTPRQIVLSGEQIAIKKAIKLAMQQGIPAYKLKTSNAFHSKLAGKAADVLAAEEFVPKELGDPKIKLFSSMDGREIRAGLLLKEHFSRQVTCQVDFYSMIKEMAVTCDLFLEIGTGRVLSGLVSEITGDKGPVCMPVESEPFNNQDLNRALAVLFINGIDINWERLYANRLIRPFIPLNKQIFIESPCERPFDSPVPEMETSSAALLLIRHLEDNIKLSPKGLAGYLEKRGDFLTQVIQADLNSLENIKEVETNNPLSSNQTEGHDKITKQGGAPITREIIEELIISLIINFTGFSRDSLGMELHLLDDLRIDSIKAGDLIFQALKDLGIEDVSIPIQEFANLTLEEIIDRLMDLAKGVTAPPDVLSTILAEASKITGYPVDSINADAKVEQDLGIGRPLLKKLLQNIAYILKINENLDLEPLLNRSLRQISSIFERILENDGPDRTNKDILKFAPWIREFAIELEKEKRIPRSDKWGNRQEDIWQMAKAVILTAEKNDPIAEALYNHLYKLGAQIKKISYRKAQKEGIIQKGFYSQIYAILPRRINSLKEIIDFLNIAACPPPAAKSSRRRTSVSFMLFNGGLLGTGTDNQESIFGVTAFAKSLHLERSDLRVRLLDFSLALEPQQIAKETIQEIIQPRAFSEVGFDSLLNRRITRPCLLKPVDYKKRDLKWSDKDIILVTGGGKGITAICALKLAQITRACMVLVGSSPHPENNHSLDPGALEISSILKQYQDHGLPVYYLSCDITDQGAVSSLIKHIIQKIGPISGVIHGAGLNIPRPINQVSPKEAFQEIAPKVMGALNLALSFKDAPPKLFVGLSSIIGIIGMPGNGWYGFSNEALDLILKRFEKDNPTTRVISVAYSIWQENGMGVRLKSIDKLKNMGIEAISTQEGINRFIRLFLNDPGTRQVIVSSRIESLDTWNPKSLPGPPNSRYLEKAIKITPGVESIFHAHLALSTDPYLKDHLFNGSYLLPTVFGLEAMAQAAAHVSGKPAFHRVRIEDIRLERPVSIDPDNGADIIIKAEVMEQEQKNQPQKIKTKLQKIRGKTIDNYFSAIFIIDLPMEAKSHELNLPRQLLKINPGMDLYRPNLLFQGPLFQQIRKVWKITSTDTNACAIFESNVLGTKEFAQKAFGEPDHQGFLLGDPFCRDTLLQSAQLLVPEGAWLPIAIDSVNIYQISGSESSFLTIEIKQDLRRSSKEEIKNHVVAVDQDGNLREKLKGYSLRFIKALPENPTIQELVLPNQRDGKILDDTICNICEIMKLEIPQIHLEYISGIHNLARDERHKKVLQGLQKAISMAIQSPLPKFTEIKWLDNGKPVVKGLKGDKIQVSLSHDERILICVAGEKSQGCDIAPITRRTSEAWKFLLGKKQDDLIKELLNDFDSIDQAGTRIWATLEALRKATGDAPQRLEIIKKKNEGILFRAFTSSETLLILTFIPKLTWGLERILAVIVHDLEDN